MVFNVLFYFPSQIQPAAEDILRIPVNRRLVLSVDKLSSPGIYFITAEISSIMITVKQ